MEVMTGQRLDEEGEGEATSEERRAAAQFWQLKQRRIDQLRCVISGIWDLVDCLLLVMLICWLTDLIKKKLNLEF
jgi:hypothetical protein